MTSSIRTIVFCTIFAVSAVYSMHQKKTSPFPALFTNVSSTLVAPASAQHLAKRAGLTWKQTGSVQFDNTGTDSDPVWELSSRDTNIYDPAGNIVLEMSSTAQSGWSRDSLESIDSTLYSNGKMSESIHNYFYRNNSGALTTGGYRYTFTYLNNNKTIVRTDYDWEDSAKTWTLSGKDSITFSSPVIGGLDYSDLSTLTGSYSWRFDTAGPGWISRGFVLKVDGESTTTRFVLIGKSTLDGNSDSLLEEKIILDFSSSVWTQENVVEQIVQRKHLASGVFVNYSRYLRAVNTEGWQIRFTEFDWNTTKSAWVASDDNIHFPDGYGNDTLRLYADFDTAASVWDTAGRNRYLRTYDTYGNNTVILYFSYNNYDGPWRLNHKTINTFAQINQSVQRTKKPAVKQNITLKISSSSVTFAGSDIEGLDLYNAAGRPVLSVTQKPGATLQINPARSSIPAGVYIALIRTGSGKTPLRLPLCR